MNEALSLNVALAGGVLLAVFVGYIVWRYISAKKKSSSVRRGSSRGDRLN